jgi:FMN reductase
MSRIVVISGSPAEVSKSRLVALDLQRQIAQRTGADCANVDIGALVPDLLVRSAAEAGPVLKAALQLVEDADLLIAASPIYKGSYTGLFKHFIDLIDYTALVDVPVALLAFGGSDRHALVVEHQLRPLFAFFGAMTLPTGVFVSDGAFGPNGISDGKILARLAKLRDEANSALAHRAARFQPAALGSAA